ncbi:deaminase domain-containing protein [Pandoraea sp.]|uniref:deaminase domain-containing protein n=1 Tax=Pandoraea sp. TaxID=1883445 RepID=UPI0035B3D251
MPPRASRNDARSQTNRRSISQAARATDVHVGAAAPARREMSNAAFALGLLAVVCTTGVAAGTVAPGGPATGLRSLARRTARIGPPVSAAPIAPSHSEAVSGVRAMLRVWPTRRDGGGVMAQCLPAPNTRALGVSPAPAESREALRTGLTAFHGDIQRAIVSMIREAVAATDEETRAAFADAEVLIPGRAWVTIVRAGKSGSPPTRSSHTASHAISLHLRDEQGKWRAYALSLAREAPALVIPMVSCSPLGCYAATYGPVLWGERWPSIRSRIEEGDEAKFSFHVAGATISPGWPSPDSSVLDSPDLNEIAELLIDTVTKRAPRDRREVAGDTFGGRSRRQAASDAGRLGALASRLTRAGLECLAAVVRADRLHEDAIALLQHLWPARSVEPSSDVALRQTPLPPVIKHESFSGELGRGVQWVLPPDVYVEYLPDLTQNGVKVFEIDGVRYGAMVARTRKHASDLRPLEDIRREMGPESLCRISRGMGADVDGMCLECHSEREGEMTVTEQGATLTQHQVVETSPLVRLRVVVSSQLFQAADGSSTFFAFGRLGSLDAQGTPRVSADSPHVDPSVYTPVLNGELTYYEQPTTEGPVGGRRVSLTLGNMRVSAPFGTYRSRSNALRGVVQLSPDVYYRFALPDGDAGDSAHQVRLHYRSATHRDIRAYRIAQHHRAAAESAIVLPTISYGEARTLLQLYLKVWEQAPSPADVWRGLEDISLSVVQARQAIRDLTQAIEHRVAAFRASPDASESSPAPDVDAALMPMFNRLWSHWQHYPAHAEAFINAVSRAFVSRPAPLAAWSQLPFVGDVQTTREVLSIFETVLPGMSGLQALARGTARSARDVGERIRAVSRNANIAVAEVTLVDGSRTIYYCLSGLQRTPLPTNAPTVRFVDAGRAYAQREQSIIDQHEKASGSEDDRIFTEPPELRFAMADADLPTYNAATGGSQSRTLDTERMILAQIYADHPLGENVVRSIVLCSRLPFCDSCAVNLAMAPYHYPDAELRFYYVAPSPRDRRAVASTGPSTSTTASAHGAAQSWARSNAGADPHEHASL